MPYNDVRDHVRQTTGRGLWALGKAARYYRTVERFAGPDDRAALAADGMIDANGYPTPRGRTLVTTAANFPQWRPGKSTMQ